MPTEPPHILIVDDDAEIRKLLADYLARNGYRTSVAEDGRAMRQTLAVSAPDLVVLDIMMPGEDGLSLCRGVRHSSNLPVILLTAMSEDTDRIVGLEMGADDYVTKPFNPRELLARIKSVLRRDAMVPYKSQLPSGRVSFGHWRFDLARREIVNESGIVVRLSSGEHALLNAFVQHPGLVLNRDQLLDLTRGREAQLFDRSIDNQVSRLRRKIEPTPAEPRFIVTHWGGGYEFTAELNWS